MTDEPGVVLDVDTVRRVLRELRVTIDWYEGLGWEEPALRRVANDLHDALIVAGAEP